MKKRLFVYLTVFIIILLFALIQINLRQNLNPQNQKVSWEKVIAKKGSRAAWEEFKTTQKGLLPSEQHRNAHDFGSILYKSENLKAVEICDSSFIYACYHSVLGEAISENGFKISVKANEFCKKLKDWDIVACQHGIGHGLMGATTYDFESLKKSLEACQNLGDATLLGCSHGVFMEYNFKTLHSGKNEFRRIDAGNLFYPCNKLSKEHRKVCYFAQPQWWLTMQKQEMSKRYKLVGSLCMTLEDEEKNACALGAGAVAPEASGWDTKKAVSLCQHMGNNFLEVYCRAGGANLKNPKEKQEFCVGLKGQDLKTCLNMSYLK